MTPSPEMPVQIAYTRRRNRKEIIEKMKAQHEQWETQALEQNFKASEAMQAIDNLDGPEELKKIARIQFENASNRLNPNPAGRVPTEEEFRRQELEQIADRFAGVYIELSETGFKTWNFAELLASDGVTRIECTKEGHTAEQPFYRVTLFKDDNPIEDLTGPAADALLRYLHFTGIFELEKAKKPCPECGHKEPQDCDTCGGLGWIV